jgi:hypothetical protein
MEQVCKDPLGAQQVVFGCPCRIQQFCNAFVQEMPSDEDAKKGQQVGGVLFHNGFLRFRVSIVLKDKKKH